MILLRNPKVLFVRARKIAGTSLSLAMSVFADNTSIVVPMFIQYEMMRIAMGGHTPVNWSQRKDVETQYSELLTKIYGYCQHKGYNPLEWTGGYFDPHVQEVLQYALKNDRHKIMQPGGRPKAHFMQYVGHLTAADIQRRLTNDFNKAHKVTIVRHPYEAFVSLAYQLRERDKRNNREVPLEKSIDEAISGGPFNSPYYFLNGELCCDTYLKVESLEEDMKKFSEKIGLNFADHMLHTRSRIREDKTPATEVLSETQKDRIYNICKQEFIAFDYEP
jgi:hypothetical protein